MGQANEKNQQPPSKPKSKKECNNKKYQNMKITESNIEPQIQKKVKHQPTYLDMIIDKLYLEPPFLKKVKKERNPQDINTKKHTRKPQVKKTVQKQSNIVIQNKPKNLKKKTENLYIFEENVSNLSDSSDTIQEDKLDSKNTSNVTDEITCLDIVFPKTNMIFPSIDFNQFENLDPHDKSVLDKLNKFYASNSYTNLEDQFATLTEHIKNEEE